jgi:hypothetical protein
VVLMAFTAEEAGLLGSAALVASNPEYLKDAVAMVNLDMVGQMRANTLSVLGTGSAAEWPAQVEAACAAARVRCTTGGDGYGPSDHTSFFAAGLPVLHLFTGAHAAYHKPSDTPEKLNVAGMVQVAQVVLGLVAGLPAQRMAVVKSQGSSPGGGDARSFGASLGTVPDYAGPPAPLKGVLLSDVRPGGAAELAGMRRGDVLVKLGATDVRSVEDLMYVLQQAKPGQTVKVVVVRDGKEVALEATYQQGRR